MRALPDGLKRCLDVLCSAAAVHPGQEADRPSGVTTERELAADEPTAGHRERSAAVDDQAALERAALECVAVDLHRLPGADVDRLAFADANPPFTPLELAPVAPLGANSVVGLVDQNKAVATSRNTEVVSDSTNVLALECAVRRRALLRTPGSQNELVRLCASHRLLRAQSYGDPLALAHFRLFALCTAGRDLGSFQFELSALHEQLATCLRLLTGATAAGYRIARLRVALTDLTAGRQEEALRSAVLDPLAAEFPTVQVGFDPDRPDGRTYYTGACFHLFAADAGGQEYQVGDGGFTTWTQLLLSNAKERLLISGLGTERLCGIFAV